MRDLEDDRLSQWLSALTRGVTGLHAKCASSLPTPIGARGAFNLNLTSLFERVAGDA